MRRALTATAGVIAVLAWAEWLDRRWSRMLVREPTGSGTGSEAVVVLGFRNAGRRANVVNRQRVRSGLRSLAADDQRSVLVLTGGAPAGGPPEARVMAAYAREIGYDGPLLTEEESRTTWENVVNVIDILEDFDRIKIVSQPAHALKARAHLKTLRPDLAERLVPAADHSLGEWLLVKPLTALYGLWTLWGVREQIHS